MSPGKSDGLNGSLQHSAKIHVQELPSANPGAQRFSGLCDL
jgi:hypothetical protein